jgi:hypothetical protein
MYDEEEVPNTKRMHVVEEEVLLSQPETTAVSPKEEEVPVPQGPVVMVLPEEEVPLEEVEIPAHAVTVPQAPLSQSRWRNRRSYPPLSWISPEGM